ncbi:glycerate kinase [Burkholderiaceae bacterium FT117]|uniref:glycerate kinase type-2 family protein n=1 Tax=Zeimonas sediminis TaxID=2944268 RepID=UPI002342DE5C|nr:glycerate kinase [Zeimonas sediminis]MCM5570796.1 glycerate kinase [Zeimonas sediminis]
MNPRELLLESFRAAVDAADPLKTLSGFLPVPNEIRKFRRTLVVGAGKAAASMARAVDDHWPGDAPLEGLVITRYAHGMPCRRLQVIEAGHPVPDEAGERAAADILRRAGELGPDDLLLVLVSGGGSSLLSLPVDAVPMADLKAVTRSLLASGAPIQEMNVVRKHLSRIQGGRLAQATRASVLALVISDVAGDDLSAIASGPCAPDPSTYADALDVLARWDVAPPESVARHLQAGLRGEVGETPKPGDPVFGRVRSELVATAHRSLEAGAAVFGRAGVRAAILGDTVTGEARDVAQVMAALAREIASRDAPFARPVALVSGGECTVTVRGKGRGGRCAEFLLALGRELDGLAGAWAIAADTDGIDGVEDNAGALLAPDSLARARVLGLDARRLLDDNDAWRFFSSLDDLVVTGPTRTNVNDYRAILLLPS